MLLMNNFNALDSGAEVRGRVPIQIGPNMQEPDRRNAVLKRASLQNRELAEQQINMAMNKMSPEIRIEEDKNEQSSESDTEQQ